MKTSIWKALTAWMLALLLALSAGAVALGETRYPTLGGVLTDDANALSQSMARDIAAYATQVESKTGLKLHVALVLFLDGEPVQTYADTLFTRWELGTEEVLLLGAAGEDTFALSAGAEARAHLSDTSLKSLLYASGFADAFRGQRYDAALGAFFVGFNDLLNKQYDADLKLDSLFAAYQPTAQASASTATTGTSVGDVVQSVVDTTSSIWNSTMNAITGNVQDYQTYQDSNDDTHGLTPLGWIVLAVIVLIIVGQSEPLRRARRRGGCGCSPIGWILGGLGLGALFGRWRDESRDRWSRGSGRHGRPPRY